MVGTARCAVRRLTYPFARTPKRGVPTKTEAAAIVFDHRRSFPSTQSVVTAF